MKKVFDTTFVLDEGVWQLSDQNLRLEIATIIFLFGTSVMLSPDKLRSNESFTLLQD
jgi:hypothetical protein